MNLSEIETGMARLDAIYRPVAQQPVELEALADLGAKIAADLDRLGVDDQAQGLLRVIVERYRSGEESDRVALRELFDQYPSFRWGAHLPYAWDNAAGFRDRVLLVSAHDQGPDARDDIMTLNDLSRRAIDLGIDPVPILAEVAELSSTIDRYGMGSVRDILHRVAREVG